MQKISIPVKIFLWLVLLACMAILAKNILFKHAGDFNRSEMRRSFTAKGIKSRLAKANLEPFATIELFYYSRKLGPEYKVGNLGGNVIGFVPLGILFPLLFGWRRGWQTVVAVFLVSLGFELTQLFFALGVFDVDDLMLNTAGGIIGYMIYWICRTIVRWKRRSMEPSSLA